MVYTLVGRGHFQIIGKMTDNRILIQTEDNIYRLYDLDQKKWYRFNEHFFNARKNGDDVEMLYVSYSGPYVIFSYKNGRPRLIQCHDMARDIEPERHACGFCC